MADESLRKLLDRVHERLNASGSIDPESRQMLATLMRDIDSATARDVPGSGPTGAGVTPAVAAESVGSTPPPAHRFEAVAVRFESEHPAIAALLRQIGALLGQAGI